MTDYISREAAFDAMSNWLKKARHPLNASAYNSGEIAAYETAIDEINQIPAADVVEVVRCWKCELWNEWDHAGHKELGNFVCSCAHWSNEDGYVVYTAPDDFCSYGEQKDGADNG